MPRIDTPYCSRLRADGGRAPADFPLWPWIAIAALAGATLVTEVLADGRDAVRVSLPATPCPGAGAHVV